MRAADPTIKLIAVGKGVIKGQDEWNSAVQRIAGPVIDYLAIHDRNTLSQNAAAAHPRAQMMARAGEFEDQLHARAQAWPISWTREDYKTTWLAPERLLLFVQAAEAKDTMSADATLDGHPLLFKRAYTSTRVHSAAFVGLYADLSKITPGAPHKLYMKLRGMDPGKLQGVFFDNVEPELTAQLE